MSRCLSVVAVAAATSCSASFPAQPTAPRPVALTLAYSSNGTTWPIVVGRSFLLLQAYVIDSDRVYQIPSNSVVWTSSNPLVCTVRPFSSGVGGVFAVAAGTAEIFAVYNGLSASLTAQSQELISGPHLSITVSVSSLIRGPDFATARVDVLSGTNTIVALDVGSAATWTSSDPSVATVSVGRISGLRVGNVEITATYNGMSASYRLSVPPASR